MLPTGFCNADLRQSVAPLLGFDPAHYRPGKMTYDLRRLRLHGLIERTPHSNRYQVTTDGMRIALFFTRAHARFFRTGLSLASPLPPTRASRALLKASAAVDQLLQEVKLAA